MCARIMSLLFGKPSVINHTINKFSHCYYFPIEAKLIFHATWHKTSQRVTVIIARLCVEHDNSRVYFFSMIKNNFRSGKKLSRLHHTRRKKSWYYGTFNTFSSLGFARALFSSVQRSECLVDDNNTGRWMDAIKKENWFSIRWFAT